MVKHGTLQLDNATNFAQGELGLINVLVQNAVLGEHLITLGLVCAIRALPTSRIFRRRTSETNEIPSQSATVGDDPAP